MLGISIWSATFDTPQDDDNRLCGRQHVLHAGAGGDGKSQSAHLLCLWQRGCGESPWLELMVVASGCEDSGNGSDAAGEL